MKRNSIFHSLCKPLSDSLLSSKDSLASGVALCLIPLVDCDNWRFCSHEMVNELCLKLAGALGQKSTQTNSHMGLVLSLAKHNSLIVEAYARLLIRAGLGIMNCASSETNSQSRLTAIQMVHSLMEWLDIRSVLSEIEFIIEELGKCVSEYDQMTYVKRAAFETLQTARSLIADKGSNIDSDVVSVIGSNFSMSGNSQRKHLSKSGDHSLSSESLESHTLNSFAAYGSFMESPILTTQASCNGTHVRKNVNRKLWNVDNGCVEFSLKGSGFSDVRESCTSYVSFEQNEDTWRSNADELPGLVPRSLASGSLKNRIPSHERTCSQINVDGIPRKLVCSLQDNDASSNCMEDQTTRHRLQNSTKYEHAKYVQNGHFHNVSQRSYIGDVQVSQSDSESLSPTEHAATNTKLVRSYSLI